MFGWLWGGRGIVQFDKSSSDNFDVKAAEIEDRKFPRIDYYEGTYDLRFELALKPKLVQLFLKRSTSSFYRIDGCGKTPNCHFTDSSAQDLFT